MVPAVPPPTVKKKSFTLAAPVTVALALSVASFTVMTLPLDAPIVREVAVSLIVTSPELTATVVAFVFNIVEVAPIFPPTVNDFPMIFWFGKVPTVPLVAFNVMTVPVEPAIPEFNKTPLVPLMLIVPPPVIVSKVALSALIGRFLVPSVRALPLVEKIARGLVFLFSKSRLKSPIPCPDLLEVTLSAVLTAIPPVSSWDPI